jgi:hypothetical protein
MHTLSIHWTNFNYELYRDPVDYFIAKLIRTVKPVKLKQCTLCQSNEPTLIMNFIETLSTTLLLNWYALLNWKNAHSVNLFKQHLIMSFIETLSTTLLLNWYALLNWNNAHSVNPFNRHITVWSIISQPWMPRWFCTKINLDVIV